jgi:hypothetical protein
MKGFDVISNPLGHITKTTPIGGILSVTAIIIAIILFRNEYASFSDKKIVKNLYVDHKSVSESLLVTLDIKLRFAPCAVLSLDVHDDLQHHRVDLPVDKIRINRNGNTVDKVC